MRVGLIVPSFATHEQDYRYPLYCNIVEGIAQHHDVVVFALFQERKHSAGYHWFKDAMVVPLGLADVTSRALRQVGNTLAQQYELDLVHAFGIRWAGALGAAITEKLSIPLLINALNEDFRYPRKTLNAGLNHVDGLIAPSQYALSRLQILVGSTKADQFIVNYGVDTKHFIFTAASQRLRDYLVVSELAEHKNLDVIIELVAHLPNTTLDIVGDGPLYYTVKDWIEQLDLTERVMLHGHQDYADMPQFYQQAQTLLVATDENELFHIPTIEAMACGTDVMGFGVGILPEITTTTDSRDLAGLQALILKRQRKHQELKRQQLRLKAEYGFSLQQMWDGFLAIYDYLLKKHQ